MATPSTLEGEYDYIIIGAGSAGCVLANRLSADPHKRVLVLEAGGWDNWIWHHIPVGYLFAIGNPRCDWMYRTMPEAGLNSSSLNYPRGKVIGGSSSINAMVYMRGQARDYDNWRQLGLTGWGWDYVLPFLKKHGDHFLGASDAHASGGECRVEQQRVRWGCWKFFARPPRKRRFKRIDDFNSSDDEDSPLSGQPAARPTLVGGACLSQAGAAPVICGSKPAAWWKRSSLPASAPLRCGGARRER